MKGQIVRGAVILLLAGLTGCVSQGTHDQVLQELQSTKNDLERVRAQNDAFSKQVIGLKESQDKLKDEVDKTHAQIALLKDEVAKRYEDALKIQRRQAKELKERANASLIQPPIQPAQPAEPAPEAPQSDGQANASSPTPAQPPSLLLVDINKATSTELAMILGLAKEDADKLIKGRPYKTKEELVTKAGLAKATVDKIQDKISVGP